MFKRIASSVLTFVVISVLGLGKASAGDFSIGFKPKITQGEIITVDVFADARTSASQVKLSVTTRQGTQSFDLKLVNGHAAQEIRIENEGSHILKVADAADLKHFSTKVFRAEPAIGGQK